MLIAEDLLLLLYDDATGKPITGSPGLDYALAGAALIELTMTGRIDISTGGDGAKPGRLKVLDTRPTDDPVLDQQLALLAEKDGKKPKDVLGKLSKGMRQKLLVRLAERGVLEQAEGKVLGIFPTTRWPARDAQHETQVRAALDSVLKLGAQPDERTAALIALLSALNVVPKVVTDAVDKRALKRRAKEIAESEWAAEAVRKAVQEMQAAVTTAVVASGAVAAGSS